MAELTPIQAVQKWLTTVVVDLNFCPFAGKPLADNKVRFVTVESSKKREVLEIFAHECRKLDSDDSIETTLIILDQGFRSFIDYLDVLDLAGQLLKMEGYEGVYQVASFHPEYCFEGEAYDDPANFTNRSPYPILHLLREESVSKAVDSHPEIDAVPERNIDVARKLGAEHLSQLLEKSHEE